MQYKNRLLIALVSLVILTQLNVFGASISTDAKLQYNKGVDYYKLGQFEDAVACFKKAVDLDPNYIDAYYNLGILLEYLNQKEAALSVFKQIILRKPDDYESVYKAAKISNEIGEPEKAKMYLALIPKGGSVGAKAQQLLETIPSTQVTKTEEPEPTSQSYIEVSSPTGIVTDSEGNIFVAGYSENTIYKITPDNKKIVFLKDERINGPIGIAIDDKDNLYIANYNSNNVLKVSKLGQITIFTDEIKNPYCLHISKGYLFISAQGSNSIIKQHL